MGSGMAKHLSKVLEDGVGSIGVRKRCTTTCAFIIFLDSVFTGPKISSISWSDAGLV